MSAHRGDKAANGVDGERQLLLAKSAPAEDAETTRWALGHGRGLFGARRRQRQLLDYNERQARLSEFYASDARRLEANADELYAELNDERRRELHTDRRLARAVFVCNLFVFAANLSAAILSGSYSVISAFIDSLMDITSSIIVQLTIRAINRTDPLEYPRGRNQLELVATVGCSSLMGAANIFVIIQSVEAILADNVHPEINVPTLIIIASSLMLKVIMMFFCYRHGTTNAKILAFDQRNDILTNVTALVCAFIGARYFALADPIGAILVCTFISISWFINALKHVPLMVGRSVAQEELSRVLAVALSHDARIKQLDHAAVYHAGEKALVELHVVLAETAPLRLTHDICESLQSKINALPFVERTFVHVDYQLDGWTDHKV